MTEVENAARNIIGVEALAKLTRAGIATVWLKDVPEERRCETCRHWCYYSMISGEYFYCDVTDIHWRVNEYCSRWEVRDD